MNEETKKRLETMTPEEKPRRFEELNQKADMTDPKTLPDHPKSIPTLILEEAEERGYLKKELGYD